MISLLIVVSIAVFAIAQYKVIAENKAIRRYGWSYSTEYRDAARTFRTSALIAFVSLIVIRGPINDFYAEMEAKGKAYMEDTFMGYIHVSDYYQDYEGTKSDFHGKVPMCNKCKHTIGSWSNPAHGHKLVTRAHPTKGMGLEIFPAELEDRYVRSCPLD